MNLNNPGPAPTYSNEGTPVEVYNTGPPPAAFTDLDLSAVVGTRAALVHLAIQNNTGGLASISTRRNGDTATARSGVTQGPSTLASGTWAYLLVDTDDNGIIEWFCTGGAGTAKVWVFSWLAE